jgi:hypothetical protein
MGTKVIVTQDRDRPVDTCVLAQSIVDISEAVKRLYSSGLNRRAIIILIANLSSQSQHNVKAVLDGMADLEKSFLSKK